MPKVGFSFTREIRLGDLVTVAGVAVAMIAWGQKLDLRLDVVEKTQVFQVNAQAATNRELRQEIREVSTTISGDLKDQGLAIRRIEDKINRARM